MRFRLWLTLCCFVGWTSATQGSDRQYVRILSLIQQADTAYQSGKPSPALAKYLQAQTELRRFNNVYPDWNPRIVGFRTNYLAEKIAALAGTKELPMNPNLFPPALRILSSARPLVISHRGYKQFAPENTLPAFQFAVAAGVDLVELDYFHSSDGIPVVFHDKTLDRTSDAMTKWGEKDLKPGAKTAEELRTLDVGSWFSPRFAGERMPLLTEALDLIQGANITLIERKEGDPATCLKLLRERDLINKVIVQAFDWTYLRDLHEQAPDQILGALGPPSAWNGRTLGDDEKALSATWLNEIDRIGVKVVVWSKEVSKASVAEAQRRGYKVWIYTVNDADLATQLLDYGVNGLISDNPAIIWKVLALRKS